MPDPALRMPFAWLRILLQLFHPRLTAAACPELRRVCWYRCKSGDGLALSRWQCGLPRHGHRDGRRAPMKLPTVIENIGNCCYYT